MASPSYLMSDIAKMAGVSLASVSLYFHQPTRVGKKTTEKIESALGKTDFVPRFVAKRLMYGNIGVLIDERRGPFGEFHSEIMLGLLEKAQELKWNLSVELFQDDNMNLPAMISHKKVDGVILISKIKDAFIQKLISKKLPYCVVDYQSTVKHIYVVPDWYQGAVLATSHLIGLGHRRLGMVYADPSKGRATLARIEGFNDTLLKAQIEIPSSFIQNGYFTREGGYTATTALLKNRPRPTAIFYASDVMALGGYDAIREFGLRIPEDLSVIGFDHIQFPYYMTAPNPSLTTVDGNRRQMGHAAILSVHNQILHHPYKVQVTLDMQMVVKGSAGPAPT